MEEAYNRHGRIILVVELKKILQKKVDGKICLLIYPNI